MVSGKRGLIVDERGEWNRERADERATFEKKSPRSTLVGVGRRCLCDSVFFPLLQVTSNLVFPIPDIGTSWRGAHWGPAVWVLPQLRRRKMGTLKGELRRKGFWQGGNRRELGSLTGTPNKL